MIDDDDSRIKPAPGTDHYGETLLYDYSKYLTTMSLLALGGVLSLSQSDDLQDVKPFNLALAIGGIIIGGVSAFSVSYDIVSSRVQGKAPSPWARRTLGIALAGIGIGLGSFINIFWKALI